MGMIETADRMAETPCFKELGGASSGKQAMHPVGFEPTTPGLGNRCKIVLKPFPKMGLGGFEKSTAPGTAPFPKDLQKIIQAWPDLAEPIKVGILALVGCNQAPRLSLRAKTKMKNNWLWTKRRTN